MKKISPTLFLGFVTVAWLLFLGRGWASFPALGELLSVAKSGLWRHQIFKLQSQSLPGLSSPVTVTVDHSGVPHFFAQNIGDLVRAQGFVMASQRLFQMDLSTRMTAGRLSEWFGERTEKIDEFFIKFGMRQAAVKSLAHFQEDVETKVMLEAFVGGVNSFIKSSKDLAPEYKILGLRPERWDSLRVIHMAKQLTYSLAGRSSAIELTKIRAEIGVDRVLDLFPDHSTLDDIIYPSKSGAVRRQEKKEAHGFLTHFKNVPPFVMPTPGNGSNNWAVDGKRSRTGFSIMANDTHLGHSLPNVWYENQLFTPEFNIYGVSLVGVPGLINGLNPNVSWGPTNGTTSVLDFIEVEFADETSLTYKVDGRTEMAKTDSETLSLRRHGGKTVQVVWTQMGPVVHREGRYGLVARWSGHDTDNELRALRQIYSSRTTNQCFAGFNYWAAPIQNFICADKSTVGISHVGRIPKREIGEGRFIVEAGTSARIYLPETLRPRLVNPESGFVLSANQRAVDDRYPFDLGWNYEEPFRGRRIRELLKGRAQFSSDDFIEMQNDTLDDQARIALPLLLAQLTGYEDMKKELSSWDYRVRSQDWRPAVFKEWFREIKSTVFADEYAPPGRRYLPKDTRLIELFMNLHVNPAHRDSIYVDDRTTPSRETWRETVQKAFVRALETLSQSQGADYRGWRFDRWQTVDIPHVARFPGFGRRGLVMDGSGDSIRGNKGNHGAVYKIVVAHGDWPDVFIQVPGGNEGDPLAPEYGRFVEDWLEGKMRKAEFYKNVEQAKAAARSVIELTPE